MSNTEIELFAKQMISTLRDYQKPNNRKAFIQILNSFLPFVGIWALMYWVFDYSLIAYFSLGVLNAFFLVRIFIIQHDCGHRSFVKSGRARDFIGYICSLMSAIPYNYWARSHNFHHSHNGQLDHRDIGDIYTMTVAEYDALSNWKKMKYRFYRSPISMFIIGPFYYLMVPNRYPLNKQKMFKPVYKSIWLTNISIIVLLITLCLLLDPIRVITVYFTVLYLFMVIAIWFFYVQHQHEDGYKQWKENWTQMVSALKGSTYYKLPGIVNWFTGNIGVHHIHHLYPTIPNYYLVEVIKKNPNFSKYSTVLTFWSSLKLMFNTLWDEKHERMISFKEYKRLYNKA